ncbi:MAG TPA: ABC transporter permease [Anaerolineae bacterium]|nr:ABC transporter permease [Anaerolineae bacterium]
MRKLWLVARYEYNQIVKKKSFLVGVLGMPALIVIIMIISIIAALGQRSDQPLGYVDYAKLLSPTVTPPLEEGEDFTEMRAFPDETTARAALDNGDIQAYYVVPKDYMETGEIAMFYLTQQPGEIIQADFFDFLRANLLVKQPEAVQRRLYEGVNVIMRAADGSREMDTENPFNFILPYIASFFFVFIVMGSAGYMLQAVTDEKENRTIEILATSLRPIDLIGGKALGLLGVGLTQIGIWIATGILALIVVSFFIEMPPLETPWSLLAVVTLFFLPAYALVAALMTAIGSAVTDQRQGQQISGIVNLLFTFPFFFIMLIMAKPDSPIVTFLTLFPTTSFVTIALRWGMNIVPMWQLIVSWILVVGAALASIWLAARIFRLGMLSYGQPLSPKHILASLREQKSVVSNE